MLAMLNLSLLLLQGQVKPRVAAEIAGRLFDMGCYEVSMGDTIGVGTPASVADMFKVCCCGTVLHDDAWKRDVMQGLKLLTTVCRRSALYVDKVLPLWVIPPDQPLHDRYRQRVQMDLVYLNVLLPKLSHHCLSVPMSSLVSPSLTIHGAYMCLA